MPNGRAATCGYSRLPAACASAERSSISRHRFGSASTWIMAKDTGRSISPLSRRIHSSSFLGATMSLPPPPPPPPLFLVWGATFPPRRSLRRELEDRLTAGGHGAAETEQLVLGGEGAGHGFAIHCAVAHGPGGGEAERGCCDRLGDQSAHRLDVVGRGRLVAGAPLAHRVRADRAVGDLAAHVDRELLPSHGVGVL